MVCAGSLYESTDSALGTDHHARTQGLPFWVPVVVFSTQCWITRGHVLGWADAEHAETTPAAARPVISLLSCASVKADETVQLAAGSLIAQAYGSTQAHEGYHCRYGLNPAFRAALLRGPLRASAFDAAGEVRAIEYTDHQFFVATLFQPERAAMRGEAGALALAFVRAAMAAARWRLWRPAWRSGQRLLRRVRTTRRRAYRSTSHKPLRRRCAWGRCTGAHGGAASLAVAEVLERNVVLHCAASARADALADDAQRLARRRADRRLAR